MTVGANFRHIALEELNILEMLVGAYREAIEQLAQYQAVDKEEAVLADALKALGGDEECGSQ